MYPISQHRLVADGALDRRTVEEQFLFWASQYNDLADYNLALRTLMRGTFKLDAHQEFYSNRAIVFDDGPHTFSEEGRLSSPDLTVKSSPGGLFQLDWSLNLKSPGGTNYVLRVCPFANGRLLWRAGDKIENEWPLLTSGPNYYRLVAIPADDGSHSLSGRGYFTANTGSFEVGLIAGAGNEISGSGWDAALWDAKDLNIVVRRVL